MQSANETETDGPFILNVNIRLFLLLLILGLALMGVVSNSINIVLFMKLRKDEPINISLLALAFSDIAICMTSFVFFFITSGWVHERIMLAMNIMTQEVFYSLLGIPHRACVRVTVLLTTIIALERCLCITMPLKVKTIVTSRRVTMLVLICFGVGTASLIPICFTTRLAWEHVPKYNKTLLRPVMTDDFYSVMSWATLLDIIFLLAIPFVTLCVCTVVMIKHLKKRMDWRQQVAPKYHSRSSGKDSLLPEKRIIMMVISISVLFLVCYTPNIALTLMVAYQRNNTMQNIDNHLLQVIYYTGFLLDTINSSVNIFVYYTNSSTYKKTFIKLFYC